MPLLINPNQIHKKISQMGNAIEMFYQKKVTEQNPLLLIGILDGCLIFTADLIRNLNLPIELAFLRAKSYEGIHSGKLRLQTSFLPETHNREILIVDDILDSGKTLAQVTEELSENRPAGIEICCLLRRQSQNAISRTIKARWSGFDIQDQFVIGFGMDYKGKFRNLPYIREFNEP